MRINSCFSTVLLLTCTILFLSNSNSYGQNLTTTLNESYRQYQVETINTNKLYGKLKDKNNFHQTTITIGNTSYDLELWDSGLRADDYQLTFASGKTSKLDSPAMLRGHIKGDPGAEVRLTINSGFLMGFITIDGRELNVQPASYHDKTADNDLMVFYYDEDVKEEAHVHSCGTNEQFRISPEKIEEVTSSQDQKMTGLCYEIEIAFASDWAMFQSHGTGVENHVLGIMNSVESNYDDEFGDEILFDVSDFWVSDCASCDPWTNTTDMGSLLNQFTGWAPNELGSHHIGSLWSDRNFGGSAVGLAWLGGACGGFGYNVCQDFTTNGNLLRVVLAHEIGHNLNAEHDGSGGLIMSPSVSNTSSWSSLSMTDIEAHLAAGAGCFIDCSNGDPPNADFDYDVISGCVPGEVAFFDDSDDAISWLWTFPGGTPSSSTDQNPVVTYNNSGSYDVTLEATNAFGSDTKIENDAFVIEDIPDALFDYDSDELEVSFFDQSLGGNLTYFWDFGDGNTSNFSEPDHVYNAPGNYTVVLEVENDCDESNYTQEIIIYDNPSANFTADFQTGCALDQFNFIDISYGNITEWSWTFPGGTPASSTLESPQVTYAAPGTYDVLLEVANPEGESTLIQTGFIQILEPPLPSFEYSVFNNTVTFENTTPGSPPPTYMWEFGDGNTSTETSPTHTYANSGSYVAILIAENDCGTQSQSVNIAISIEPIAQIGASSATSGCATHQMTYEDQSAGNPTSWNWTFPGGTPASSTQQNPVVNYTQQGNHNVTLAVSNAFGADTITMTNFVMVDDVPVLTATQTSNLLTTSFSSSTSNATSVSWNFGDGNSSSIASPVHTYATAGTYNASVTASNTCGTVTENLTVTVTENPVAVFSSNVTSGCTPLTVGYADNSTGNPTSWNWTFPGGTPATSTARNPSVSYAQAGNYSVTLQVGNASGSDVVTSTNYVTVSATPTLEATVTNNLLQAQFNSTYSGASSVNWNFGDGNGSTTDNPSHTYGAAGTYNVSVTASNSCGSVTENLTITVDLTPSAGITSNVSSGCAPLTVTYGDVSGGNPTAWNWTFPGGTPATSTARNPVVTYAQAGTYSVTLLVSNSAGSDQITMTDYLTVQSDPTLTVGYSNNQLDARFTSSYSNASGVSWNFGDGTGSNEDNPSHTFSGPGTYNVTATVSNPCGSATETLTVTVNQGPTAGIRADVQAGCAPLTVNFQDASSSNTTAWDWRFPGGNPSSSTEQNPVITYATAGAYDVTLNVSNSEGTDSQTWNEYIKVSTTPNTSYDYEVVGNVINLINTTMGSSASWAISDGTTSSLQNYAHTFRSNGTFQVTLETTNNCGSDQASFEVTIDVYPTSNFEVSSGSTGCAPLTVEYTSTSTEASGYLWNFPGGNPSSSAVANPVVVYNTPGNYDAILQVTNSFGFDTETQNAVVTVLDVPVANFQTSSNGAEIRFSNTSSAGTTSYSWDFGDGTSSTLENPSHTYDQAGNYVVSFTATNDCGSNTIERVVVANFTLPTISSSFSQSSGCAPLEVAITDESTNDPTAWFWEFPGGTPTTSTDQNPVVTYDVPGIYTISAVVSNADGSSSIQYTDAITVAAEPVAEFDVTQDSESISITNSSIGATSYSWDFGDGTSSSDAEPMHTYNSTGEYIITLTATNACGTTASSFTVTVDLTGVADFKLDWEWSLAPNPTAGQVALLFAQPTSKDLNYEILDLMGRKISEGYIPQGTKEKRTVLAESGIYLIVIRQGALLDVKRLVVMK